MQQPLKFKRRQNLKLINFENIEMKKIEAEGRKALPPATTNVLIATRDEIMTKIFEKGPKKIDS